MKLGTETGSLVNHIYARSPGTPVVGEGATVIMWSDRRPGTVVAISASGKTVIVREDSYRRVDGNGVSESQEYEISPDPKGYVYTFRATKRGWRSKEGFGVTFGHRNAYYDYNF